MNRLTLTDFDVYPSCIALTCVCEKGIKQRRILDTTKKLTPKEWLSTTDMGLFRILSIGKIFDILERYVGFAEY